MHSTISGDSQLDDHRNQNLSLPMRSDSRLNQSEADFKKGQTTKAAFKGRNRSRKSSHGSYMSTGSSRGVSGMSEQPAKVNINTNLNSRDLLGRMVVNEDEDEDEYAVKFNDRYRGNANAISFASNSNTPTPILNVPPNSKSRSKSFSEQVRSFIRPKEDSVSGGILLRSNSHAESGIGGIGGSSGSGGGGGGDGEARSVDEVHSLQHGAVLAKVVSRASSRSLRRKVSNDPDSDLDSHASRESQETEEDVCFPMLPEHVRIRGIDFDEIDEFIVEQREENERIAEREKELRMDAERSITTSLEKTSSAALRYIPKNIQDNGTTSSEQGTDEKVVEEDEEEEEEEEEGGEGRKDDFVTFNPLNNRQEDDELPTRFSFFSSEREETLHAADIPSLVLPGQSFKELFEPEDSIWWLDCSCPTDNEMKMLAKAFSIHPLTAEDIRMQETREKVELFKSYYFVSFHTFETDSESEDFLEPINVYIVVFSSGILTFHFSPIVNPANVRRRVRQLRDYLEVSADWLCYAMIDDITDGFAPIIQSIEYEADAIEDSVFLSRDNDFGTMLRKIGESRRKVMTLMRLLQGKADVIKMFAKRCQDEEALSRKVNEEKGVKLSAQPRSDIALFLGDIQDHIITMFQSLLSYEKIFSRSHANYLAQLQVESFYTNVQVTDLLSKVTILGTVLLPMNFVTGLFGMNVKVPGEGGSNYGWFGGIIGFMVCMIALCFGIATMYLRYVERKGREEGINSGISVKSFGFGRRKKAIGRQRGNDAVSLPTKFTKYGDW